MKTITTIVITFIVSGALFISVPAYSALISIPQSTLPQDKAINDHLKKKQTQETALPKAQEKKVKKLTTKERLDQIEKRLDILESQNEI